MKPLALWAAFIAGFYFAKWDSRYGTEVGYGIGEYMRLAWLK